MHPLFELFDKDEVPYENLISDLSHSAAHMRGKKSGIEKRYVLGRCGLTKDYPIYVLVFK